MQHVFTNEIFFNKKMINFYLYLAKVGLIPLGTGRRANEVLSKVGTGWAEGYVKTLGEGNSGRSVCILSEDLGNYQ